MNRYYLGLDLGQVQDYTALCIIETEPSADPLHKIRHLQRFKIGTPYPAIVSEVHNILDVLPAGTSLVVDHTGVGRPVVDLFRAGGLSPVAVTITGGDNATFEGGYWRVPKRDLVSALTIAFQNKRLQIAEALPESKTLVTELLNFKVKINLKTAHDSYEAWREGIHDDLVLAVALAVWYSRKTKRNLENEPTVQEAVVNSIQATRYDDDMSFFDDPYDLEDLW